MGLFGRSKKKKEAEKRKLKEIKKLKQIKLSKLADEKRLKEEIAKLKKPAEKKSNSKKTVKTSSKKTSKNGPCGKYEIYPEAGLSKYRLRASNGEILVVSFGYASKNGVKNGIETFIKAVETSNFEIITDKAGFSHFDLFEARWARVIAIGEFYKTIKLAESAVESVKKFYKCDKVLNLDKIAESEIREVVVRKQKVEKKINGKYQLSKEGSKAFFVKLLASNGQVLLVSQKYASKQSALKAIESIKNAIENQNFTIYKDKQNRYQYNLYTDNKQLIVSGETYPQKTNCLSSIQSVIRFSDLAKAVEI